MNKYAIAFKWAVIFGILCDWFYLLPGIFMPNAVIADLNGMPATLVVWPAFGCLLLFLVSLFFFSGACDIDRYRFNAWMAVLSRLAVVFLLVCLYPSFPQLAWGSFVLMAVQAVLLSNAIRTNMPARP